MSPGMEGGPAQNRPPQAAAKQARRHLSPNPYRQRSDGGWCRCSVCGRTFGGLYGFDLHRMDQTRDPYDWRCADDAELGDRGLHLSAKGWWVRLDGRSTPRLSTRTAAA
jgi:hypothetical protein